MKDFWELAFLIVDGQASLVQTPREVLFISFNP